MAYTGNISVLKELFVFALVLSFKGLCFLYIIHIHISKVVSFSFKLFYNAIFNQHTWQLYHHSKWDTVWMCFA